MKALRHKVLDLIKSFSNTDKKEFRKFITSPYFSNGRNYLPLFNEIAKNFHCSGAELYPQRLYSVLYPDKKFSLQTLKNRLSELYKLGEEFIIFKRFKEVSVEREQLLLQEYLKKRLFRLFESKYRKTKKMVEYMPESSDKFKSISFLKGINLSLLDKKNTSHMMQKQFYERSVYSICIFLIEIFQTNIELMLLEYDDKIIESNIVEEIIKSLRIEELINNFQESDVIIQKVVCIYYYLYKAFANPGEDHYYFKMRKIFKDNLKSFSSELKEEIYKSIINFCIFRQNSGIKKFQLELFNIYNEKLNQGLFSEFSQSSYPVNTFRDYVLIGIEIRKFKAVEDFIRKYSKELPEEIRDDEINISYAKLFFAEKKFDKAMKHLKEIRGQNYLHYLDASVLKLCCYYEFSRIEDSFYEVDKFKHYIRNHKEIPEIHKVPNRNFISIYQKIINNKSGVKDADLGFLEKEILSLKFISKGNWLLEKVLNESSEKYIDSGIRN
jgi:hypothetical protein